jgi:hypothetical protein
VRSSFASARAAAAARPSRYRDHAANQRASSARRERRFAFANASSAVAARA